MSRRKIFREGQRFGRLVAVEYVHSKKYKCICDCGKEKIANTVSLVYGHTRSCGCISSVTRRDYDQFSLEKLKKSINILSSGCWEWEKSKHRQGYGHFPYKGKIELAHRISWILHNGKIPEHVCVCHRCDNPSCCNPDHLFLGNTQDNCLDKEAKNRGNQPKGSKHYNSKLKENQIIQMRNLREKGFTYLEISKKFGISRCHVGLIIRRECWKHVK